MASDPTAYARKLRERQRNRAQVQDQVLDQLLGATGFGLGRIVARLRLASLYDLRDRLLELEGKRHD